MFGAKPKPEPTQGQLEPRARQDEADARMHYAVATGDIEMFVSSYMAATYHFIGPFPGDRFALTVMAALEARDKRISDLEKRLEKLERGRDA